MERAFEGMDPKDRMVMEQAFIPFERKARAVIFQHKVHSLFLVSFSEKCMPLCFAVKFAPESWEMGAFLATFTNAKDVVEYIRANTF